MRIKLALLENDANYLNRIVTVFSTKYADNFEIYSFTDDQVALSSLDNAKIDVLVASDVFDIDVSKLPNRCGFAYFVDSLDINMKNDQRAICKFQKADLIYRQRQGIGLPNKIYVKFPDEAFSSIDKKSSLRRKENYPSDGQKTISSTDNNVSTNKNKRSNNYSANKPYNQRIYESEEYESL